jgi:hypothetical protein
MHRARVHLDQGFNRAALKEFRELFHHGQRCGGIVSRKTTMHLTLHSWHTMVDRAFVVRDQAGPKQGSRGLEAFREGPQRIGLMGWSDGWWTTLYAVDSIYLTGLHATPFQAAIAFYPWCIPTTAVGSLCRDAPGLLHTSPQLTGA